MSRTTSVKYLSTFQTAGYKHYLEPRYNEAWTGYQNLTIDQEREAFFANVKISFRQ